MDVATRERMLRPSWRREGGKAQNERTTFHHDAFTAVFSTPLEETFSVVAEVEVARGIERDDGEESGAMLFVRDVRRSCKRDRMKNTVSSGPATQRTLQVFLALQSLPEIVKRSPTCKVSCSENGPRYRINAPMPTLLLPTSQNTSPPPLKMQYGIWVLSRDKSDRTLQQISSKTSNLTGIDLGTIPTARSFLRSRTGSRICFEYLISAFSASSSTSAMVSSPQFAICEVCHCSGSINFNRAAGHVVCKR
mmetsp:Transcript_6192/g.9553  ORF Transcript_6192/g.9553 Transcript_6192/m.9553 type:complete len:250 (-) Transcript_6192:1198-1947(-)